MRRTTRTFAAPAVGATSLSLPPAPRANVPAAATVNVTPSGDVSTRNCRIEALAGSPHVADGSMPNDFTVTAAGSCTVIVGDPPKRSEPQPLRSLPSIRPLGPQPNAELSPPVKATTRPPPLERAQPRRGARLRVCAPATRLNGVVSGGSYPAPASRYG